MLSAFIARPIIELRQRDKSKIETILAYGDRVLVGLNTGSLRIYRLNNLSPSSTAADISPPNGNGNDKPANNHDAPSDTPPSNSVKPTELLREVEKFSFRAIEQLAIIKEANTIVSLSGYHVSLHDLQSYELIETLSRTKNATCFAVTSNIVKDDATGIPEIISRLAVAVKRRLLLWSWHESELEEDVEEIVLPESIRTLTWANGTKIVCGMNAGYVLVDVEFSSMTDIMTSGVAAAAAGGQGTRFGAASASMGYMGLGGYVPKPLAAKLADGEMLLAKDINTLFIYANDGSAIDNKRQIPWQTAPDAIGYSYPYILALQGQNKGSLEVRNPNTLSLLQNISLPGAAQLHFPPPTVSLAHAGKGFHISSDRVVWKMDATDYDAQITELIKQEKHDETISVLGMLEDALLKDKTGTMREVKMRKAELLFKAKKYRQSMDLFNEDEVNAPPERVLRLFPKIIAGDLSEEVEKSEEGVATPDQDQGSEVISEGEGTDSSPEKTKTNGEKVKEDITDAASPSRAGGFARYYWPIGGGSKKAEDDVASIASSKKGQATTKDDDAASIQSAKPTATTDDGSLEGKDVRNAVLELNSYLAGTRARLQRVLDPTTGKLKRPASGSAATTPSQLDDQTISSLLANRHFSAPDQQLEESLRATFTLVDTTLFRAYMFSKLALAGSLVRIPNFCDPKVVTEKLLKSQSYNELVDFLYGKKLHREALRLLRRFGTAEDGENNETEGDADATREKKKRKWWSSRASTFEKSANDDTRELDDEQRKDVEDEDELAVDLPASSIPEQLRGPQRTVLYLQSLPPDLIDLILEYAEWVLRVDPNMGMEIFLADTENAETLPRDRVIKFLGYIDESSDLEIRYLEHIVGELGDATPEFHNRLVEILVKSLKGRDQDVQDKPGGRMQSLIKFLRESGQYSLNRAFALIPRDDPAFYEAQAVVLSNMGQHNQALQIYVFKMKDYAKAEDYCNRVHKALSEGSRPSSPSSRRAGRPLSSSSHKDQSMDSVEKPDNDDDATSIYHALLALYLTPPPPHERNLEPALDLLSKHGSRLPATSTMTLIPDTLPVAELEPYFFGRIRAANSKLAESRVVEGLRRTLYVDTQATLLLGDGLPGSQGGRNRRVVISEERVCGVCHKRLGNSVVAVLPDNGVVHYGCLGKSVSGSVRGRVAGAWGRSS